MSTVISRDGTTIAYERQGTGPAVILISGALLQRASDQTMVQLGHRLAEHFTVLQYDRRGRGASTDTAPFSMAREIEDLEALLKAAGGSAGLYGISSGGALALEAALQLGPQVQKLAVYEIPYNSARDARERWRTYSATLNDTLAAGRRGDAVALFMHQVGLPADHIAGLRSQPFWPMLEAVAPTLAYDAAALGPEAAVPLERVSHLSIPTLVLDGGASDPFMHETALALAQAIPNARQVTLPGQTHAVSAEALAPILIEFFET